MRRRLAFAALPPAAAAATFVVLAFRTTGAQPLAAETAAPLTVTSAETGWRAPGVPLAVGGFAGAHERVVLRANGSPVAAATAGALGCYRLRFVPARPGRYRLVVSASGRVSRAGSVLVRPVVLDAVGDITFGEQVGPALVEHGASYPWTFVAPTLRAADITIGNLETAVSTRGSAAVKQYTFRGPPTALVPLHTLAGFDVLTLANNHTVDFGRDALLDSVRAVHAAGMQTI